jgi:hypothetical protein
MRYLDREQTSGEKKKLQGIYNEEQRQERNVSAKQGLLASSGRPEEYKQKKIRVCICKIFKDFDDLSVKFLYSVLTTVAQRLEESNEDLSRYFNIIEKTCKRAHTSIATQVKLDLQDLDELRHKKWNGEIHV